MKCGRRGKMMEMWGREGIFLVDVGVRKEKVRSIKSWFWKDKERGWL